MTVQKDFPQPPGGKLICEDGQTAVIRIKNGVITASCTTPPPGISIHYRDEYSQEFKKWAIALVKGRDFGAYTRLTEDDDAILAAGVYLYRDANGTRVRVEFKLPALNERPGGGGQTMAM